MERDDYIRLEEIARAIYAYCDNDAECPDQIGGMACEIMQMLEASNCQLEGPKWWRL